MLILLPVLLCLSLLGCYLGYSLYIKRSFAFFPILYVASTVVILYLTGLFGSLIPGFVLVIGGGIALIPLCVIKKKDEIIPSLKKLVADPSFYFMIIGAVWVFVITRGVLPSHSDDFSHWFRICKMMHYENAYPTNPDLGFTTYAPGTATWIWFITTVAGYGPDKCFFAHSLINLAALNAFFSVKGKKYLTPVFVVVISIALCAMDVNTYCLLTDTTIALVPLAAMFFIMKEEKKDYLKGFILFTLLMCLEILIKVSGIPFVVFVCLYRIKVCKDYEPSAKLKKTAGRLLPLILPIGLFYTYVIRANIVFGNIELSGQGFSITRFLAMFFLKTGDDINAIIRRFGYEMFAFFGDISMQVRLIWISFIAMAVIILVMGKKNTAIKNLKSITLALFVFFAVYSVILLLTYLFSMYVNEADSEHLNSFFRYIGSVAIFVFGVLAYKLYEVFSEEDGKKGITGACAVTVASLLVGTVMFNSGYILGADHLVSEEHFTTNAWELLTEYAEERTEYNEDSYFVVYHEEDVMDDFEFKTRIAAGTYLRTNYVYAVSVEVLEEGSMSESDRETIRNCDYLLTLGDMEDELDIIREYVDVDSYVPGVTDLSLGK